MKIKIIQFIDIETTHLRSGVGEIIEIAILTSYDGGLTIAHQWCSKIKPNHIETADPRALDVNHYCPFVWSSAPEWADMWPVIVENIEKKAIIVAHNILFDAEWINTKIGNHRGWSLPRNKICTQSLALEHLPTAPSSSMWYLRKLFGMSDILSHTAVKDALDCHLIYKKLSRSTAIKRLWWRYKIWRMK